MYGYWSLKNTYCNVILNIYYNRIFTNWILHTILVSAINNNNVKTKYYNILKGNKCFRVNALLFAQTSVCTKTEYYLATYYRLLPTGGGIY